MLHKRNHNDKGLEFTATRHIITGLDEQKSTKHTQKKVNQQEAVQKSAPACPWVEQTGLTSYAATNCFVSQACCIFTKLM